MPLENVNFIADAYETENRPPMWVVARFSKRTIEEIDEALAYLRNRPQKVGETDRRVLLQLGDDIYGARQSEFSDKEVERTLKRYTYAEITDDRLPPKHPHLYYGQLSIGVYGDGEVPGRMSQIDVLLADGRTDLVIYGIDYVALRKRLLGSRRDGSRKQTAAHRKEPA